MNDKEIVVSDDKSPSLGGRPFHAPDDRGRSLVELMAGMGATLTDISSVLGIAPMTLKRHYALELESGKAKMDAEAYDALRRGIRKDDPQLIKYYLDRRAPQFKPDPERSADVSVSIQMTVDDILKRIDGKTTGIPKFNKTIEQEPPVDAK